MANDELLDSILGKLERGDAPDRRWPDGKGDFWSLCPFHPDHHAKNFSVGPRGYCCFVCGNQGGLQALAKHLDVGVAAKARPDSGRIVAVYNYMDEQGNLLFQTVRSAPKNFWQRRPSAGGWKRGMRGVRRVLYCLPELLAADPQQWIFVCEGEKSTESIRSLGLVATTNPLGAAKWRSTYTDTLQGRKICILPDNDDIGRHHAQIVAASLPNAIILELPGNDFDKADPSDWVKRGGTREELVALADFVPPSHRLPTIVVTNRQLTEIADEVVSALVTANNPPILFIKAASPTRLITDENERTIAQQLPMNAWQGVVDGVAIFQKYNAQGDVLNAFPNDAIVRAVLARPPQELPFPPLLAIIQTPVVRPDGSLLLKPGYDPITRLYYSPGSNFELPSVPERPTTRQVQKAFRLLREPIAEFPFVAEADAANALALLLTPLVRPMLPHGVPMALLDKPERGTGASLLAEVVALLATGRPAPMMKAPVYEEEWDKRITAMLLEGRTLVVIDNVDAPLHSESLSMALTSNFYLTRRLGHSQELALPHRIVWVATGNNISFKDSDMPRRCYRVRLDAGMAQPWLHRKGFRHPRLKDWVSRYRGRILCAALAIIRAWIQNGKPSDPDVQVLGSYEDWCETLGGILKFVGQKGFLGNLDKLYEEDTGRSEWDGWVETLWEVFGERRFTAVEVAAKLNPSAKPNLLEALPADLVEKRRRGGSFNRSLGRAFTRHKGHATVSGLVQLRGTKARSGWHWFIAKQEEQQRQGVFDFFQEKESGKS